MMGIEFLRLVKTLAWREYVLYPQANIIDYYKLFYQGTFGPGHIINDRKAAYEQLLKELNEFQNTQIPFFQDISFINPYCRVSLEIVEKKLIEPEELFELLLKSCKIQNYISPIEWYEAWQKIENILFIILPKLKDQTLVDNIHESLYGNNLPIFRHSDLFRNTYRPHYRLIRKDLLPKHIQLYIK